MAKLSLCGVYNCVGMCVIAKCAVCTEVGNWPDIAIAIGFGECFAYRKRDVEQLLNVCGEVSYSTFWLVRSETGG